MTWYVTCLVSFALSENGGVGQGTHPKLLPPNTHLPSPPNTRLSVCLHCPALLLPNLNSTRFEVCIIQPTVLSSVSFWSTARFVFNTFQLCTLRVRHTNCRVEAALRVDKGGKSATIFSSPTPDNTEDTSTSHPGYSPTSLPTISASST